MQLLDVDLSGPATTGPVCRPKVYESDLSFKNKGFPRARSGSHTAFHCGLKAATAHLHPRVYGTEETLPPHNAITAFD